MANMHLDLVLSLGDVQTSQILSGETLSTQCSTFAEFTQWQHPESVAQL